MAVMWKNGLAVGGMVVVAGLLAVTVPTTVSLARIDRGLQSSLQTTQELARVQSGVIENNRSLGPLLRAAQQMQRNLVQTQQVTEDLNRNIATIDQLNAATLRINQAIAGGAHGSANNLQAIASNLKSLDAATASLAKTLRSLDQLVAEDETGLAAMRAAADEMNAKVPGVTG
ncbi:MAG: hypothetical protein K6T78_09225 [Alicyclobacillus sp.]|nr:hypothetical protein [Alicyclobacillus sp.]